MVSSKSSASLLPLSILESWLAWFGISWLLFALLIGSSLMLLLLQVAIWDSILTHPFGARPFEARPFEANYWRFHLLGPVMVMYLILLQPFLRRLENNAVQAFRPLLTINNSDFSQLVTAAYPLNRWHEWLAAISGISVGLLLDRPWNDTLSWTKGYEVVVIIIGFALTGWLIYSLLIGSKLLALLHRQPLKFDIFNPAAVEPIARRSLGITAALIGIITLSVIFFPPPLLRRIETIVVLSILTLIAIVLFFFNLRDTHHMMAEAKKQALLKVRHNLWVGYQEVADWATITKPAAGREAPSETVKSILIWTNYEKRIAEAPEWPYSGGIIGRLAVTLLLPTTVLVMRSLIVIFLTSGGN